MKKIVALLSVCSACLCLLPRPALPCTAFVLDNGTAQVVGKNMDWNSDRGMLVVNKRGVQKKSLALPSQESLTWISTYGSITFAYTREFPLGGMNEAGLVVEVTALKESTYPPEDSRTPLQASQWIQYQLDNFSTVEEVLATDARVRIPQPDHLGLQYLVSDSSRQSAVIACIDGKTVVHAAEKLPYAVLANRPYAASLAYLGRYQGYGGRQPISWSRALVRLYGLVPTWNSQPRFAYAVDLLRGKKTSGSATLEDAFEVLAAVAQPKFSLAPTQWSAVYDVPGRSIAFKTRGNDSVRHVRLSAVDFSCTTPVKALDINAKLSGDVANSFVDYTGDMGREMLEQLFLPLPDELLDMIAAYPETHTRCTDAPPPEEVYGYAGEPDPPGAETISEELYESLGAAGNWIPVTKDDAHEREAADRAQDLLDEDTILEAGEPLPEEPPDDDELVRPTPDGNYLLRVAFEDGGELYTAS